MEVQHAVESRVGIGAAAAIAGLSADTLRRAADAGKIPHTRTPGGQRRFRVADVLQLAGDFDPAPASPQPSVAGAPVDVQVPESAGGVLSPSAPPAHGDA